MRRVTVVVAIVSAINMAVAIVILRLSSSPARYVVPLAIVSALVVAGLVLPERRRVLFLCAAVVELVLGILGMFSIGLPLVAASVVLFVAADAPAERQPLSRRDL